MPLWAGKRSPYSGWLRVGRSGDRIPVGARFSTPVQTGPGAHPASCRMGTGSFPGVKNSRGVTLALTPFQCRSHERVELYLYSTYGPYCLYRASVPVHGCTLPFTVMPFINAPETCDWPVSGLHLWRGCYYSLWFHIFRYVMSYISFKRKYLRF